MPDDLPASRATELRRLDLTYPEVGRTRDEDLPVGYHHVEDSVTIPTASFDLAVSRLMTWQVQEGAGLRVSASSPRISEGDVVEMSLGPRWLGISPACRVVYVIDEPDRVGFAYGTLPGHPECGEESFVLERTAGSAIFTVRAFSRPASRMARLGGPAGRLLQTVMTRRYLRAITR